MRYYNWRMHVKCKNMCPCNWRMHVKCKSMCHYNWRMHVVTLYFFYMHTSIVVAHAPIFYMHAPSGTCSCIWHASIAVVHASTFYMHAPIAVAHALTFYIHVSIAMTHALINMVSLINKLKTWLFWYIIWKCWLFQKKIASYYNTHTHSHIIGKNLCIQIQLFGSIFLSYWYDASIRYQYF